MKIARLFPLLLLLSFFGCRTGIKAAKYAATNPPQNLPTAENQLQDCKSNLKNIGTAMEMWSTDFNGEYPDELEKLVPNYLRTLPTCPAAGEMNYKLKKRNQRFRVSCGGHHHADSELAEDFPRYDNNAGLQLEAPPSKE